MNANSSIMHCFYSIASAAWLYRWPVSVGWLTTLVRTEISQQPVNGLPRNFVKKSTFSKGGILLNSIQL